MEDVKSSNTELSNVYQKFKFNFGEWERKNSEVN